jgi:hypothetical protein
VTSRLVCKAPHTVSLVVGHGGLHCGIPQMWGGMLSLWLVASWDVGQQILLPRLKLVTYLECRDQGTGLS